MWHCTNNSKPCFGFLKLTIHVLGTALAITCMCLIPFSYYLEPHSMDMPQSHQPFQTFRQFVDFCWIQPRCLRVHMCACFCKQLQDGELPSHRPCVHLQAYEPLWCGCTTGDPLPQVSPTFDITTVIVVISIIIIILPTDWYKWYFPALIYFSLMTSEIEHLLFVHEILLLSTDCSYLLPIFLLLLCSRLIWRSVYSDIFVIRWKRSVSILVLCLLPVLHTFFLKPFNIRNLPFRSLQTQERLLVLLQSGSTVHKLQFAVSFWKIFSVPAQWMPKTTPRDAAQGPAPPRGVSDRNHSQVQLTALQKHGSLSFSPLNPDMQTTLQLGAKNKLKARPLRSVE